MTNREPSTVNPPGATGALLFLHGPPATGKFTIGREFAALTGFELYHNHLVVDAVLEHHAFGTPGFIAERDRRWREYFSWTMRGASSPRIIFTFNPEDSVPQGFIDWLFAALPAAGLALHSVGLVASESAIEQRLGSAQRRGFRKLVDLELYRALRSAGTFTRPTIPRTDLLIDTEATVPAVAAVHIRDHFKLG